MKPDEIITSHVEHFDPLIKQKRKERLSKDLETCQIENDIYKSLTNHKCCDTVLKIKARNDETIQRWKTYKNSC
jgi:hypothetical protein